MEPQEYFKNLKIPDTSGDGYTLNPQVIADLIPHAHLLQYGLLNLVYYQRPNHQVVITSSGHFTNKEINKKLPLRQRETSCALESYIKSPTVQVLNDYKVMRHIDYATSKTNIPNFMPRVASLDTKLIDNQTVHLLTVTPEEAKPENNEIIGEGGELNPVIVNGVPAMRLNTFKGIGQWNHLIYSNPEERTRLTNIFEVRLSELLAKFYFLTGGIPANFSLIAGDIVAFPQYGDGKINDIRLALITSRGNPVPPSPLFPLVLDPNNEFLFQIKEDPALHILGLNEINFAELIASLYNLSAAYYLDEGYSKISDYKPIFMMTDRGWDNIMTGVTNAFNAIYGHQSQLPKFIYATESWPDLCFGNLSLESKNFFKSNLSNIKDPFITYRNVQLLLNHIELLLASELNLPVHLEGLSSKTWLRSSEKKYLNKILDKVLGIKLSFWQKNQNWDLTNLFDWKALSLDPKNVMITNKGNAWNFQIES